MKVFAALIGSALSASSYAGADTVDCPARCWRMDAVNGCVPMADKVSTVNHVTSRLTAFFSCDWTVRTWAKWLWRRTPVFSPRRTPTTARTTRFSSKMHLQIRIVGNESTQKVTLPPTLAF